MLNTISSRTDHFWRVLYFYLGFTPPEEYNTYLGFTPPEEYNTYLGFTPPEEYNTHQWKY